ncbi:hypothetical protein [Nocardioides sp. AN3]
MLSELMKVTPESTALAWAQGIDPADLTVCVVTVEEIERGLGRSPEGRLRIDGRAEDHQPVRVAVPSCAAIR